MTKINKTERNPYVLTPPPPLPTCVIPPSNKQLRTVRLCILDLLLENVEQRGPNLSHLLLGLTSSSTFSSSNRSRSGVARGGGGMGAGEPCPSACLEAVVGLLRSPMVMEQEPRLAEKWCVRREADLVLSWLVAIGRGRGVLWGGWCGGRANMRWEWGLIAHRVHLFFTTGGSCSTRRFSRFVLQWGGGGGRCRRYMTMFVFYFVNPPIIFVEQLVTRSYSLRLSLSTCLFVPHSALNSHLLPRPMCLGCGMVLFSFW